MGAKLAIDMVMYIGLPLLLLALGFTFGRLTEARHLARLQVREQELSAMLVTDVRGYLPAADESRGATIIIAEVVIATDYFKSFLAWIRNIFGGEVKSYSILLLRARREAICRLLDQARSQGYNAICNVRLETADIGGNAASRKGANMAAILGSATAYVAVAPAPS